MKLNKIFLGLLGLGAMVMSACSSSDDYQWAKLTGGNQVYFSNELPSSQTLSMSSTSFTIPVSRVSTNDAQTVNISLTSDDNVFSAPSSVSFAAGSSTADLVVSYDPEALGYDNAKNATLTITDTDQTNAYGNATYSFSAVIPSPYKSLGKGTFLDDYYFGKEASVTIMQNQENKNVYRIMAPYKSITGGGDAYLEVTVCKPGDTFRNVTVTQNDLVYFADFNTGYHHSSYDADINLYHPSKFSSYNPESFWLHNKVLAYQEDGVTPGQIQLAPFYYMDGVGGWNATQEDGAIVITFPGYAPKDFSATMSFLGAMQGADGNAYATVSVELGADATKAKAFVVSADADAEAVADALAAGDVEGTAVENGVNFIPIEEGLTGKLMVVLAVISDGAAKNLATSNFEYYGGGANPWKSIGTGILTDNLFITMYRNGESNYDPYTFEVEIEENSEQPGLYRLVDPFEVYGFEDYTSTNFEINATDPDGVYIEMQATGVDDGDGMTYIGSYGGYMLQKYDFEILKTYGYFGTLKDGVITLPSFPVKDDDGNVQYTYQGIFAQGSGAWYAGVNSEFKLVLPEAVPASARAKAKANAKARRFAKRMNAYGKGKSYSMKEMKKLSVQNAPIAKAQMIAE